MRLVVDHDESKCENISCAYVVAVINSGESRAFYKVLATHS